MTEDQTLLEKAARAAGYNFQWEPALLNEAPEPTVFSPEGFGQYWNPLTSDGDALRLAVALGIGAQCHRNNNGEGYALASTGCPEIQNIESGDDPYAATRRAIVRAAASLAKDAGGAEV